MVPLDSVVSLARRKAEGPPISMVTAYDTPSARIAARSKVDCLLVGDSVAMVVHGHANTLAATVEMMALHTSAVARGAGRLLIVADLPFLAHRQGTAHATSAAGTLVRAGAHAVKLEGIEGHEDVVRHLVGSGIPVVGHLGLTPQSILTLGGFRVQGRSSAAADRLAADASRLEAAGACAIVLEGMPAAVADRITASLRIPTIGIGAGAGCDGQVLVWHDLLGLQSELLPRFVRRFATLEDSAVAALDAYAAAVAERSFPRPEESYG